MTPEESTGLLICVLVAVAVLAGVALLTGDPAPTVDAGWVEAHTELHRLHGETHDQLGLLAAVPPISDTLTVIHVDATTEPE